MIVSDHLEGGDKKLWVKNLQRQFDGDISDPVTYECQNALLS